MDDQLSLPASWARVSCVPRNRDAAEELDRLARDRLDAKHEIRLALDRLAGPHAIPAKEVDRAIYGYVDDMLGDLTYEVEQELRDEIDRARDIC